MIISESSQLGLRFRSEKVKVDFCRLSLTMLEGELSTINEQLDFLHNLEKTPKDENGNFHITEEEAKKLKLEYDEKYQIVLPEDDEKKKLLIKKISSSVQSATRTTCDDIQSLIQECKGSKYFLICDSVYHAASLIQIGENFTSRTLKDINLGHYTYLMGKNKMLRFIVVIGAIKGFYYDDKEKIIVEFGLDIETGEYYARKNHAKLFSMIMQVLTFVELGDIETIILEKGKNNGGKKDVDKIHNSSNNTVYVVDSSWNKIIIRTEGFAVRGHFRLQPCGENMRDRKLLWIHAFEKHGYTRRPKAEIVRN